MVAAPLPRVICVPFSMFNVASPRERSNTPAKRRVYLCRDSMPHIRQIDTILSVPHHAAHVPLHRRLATKKLRNRLLNKALHRDASRQRHDASRIKRRTNPNSTASEGANPTPASVTTLPATRRSPCRHHGVHAALLVHLSYLLFLVDNCDELSPSDRFFLQNAILLRWEQLRARHVFGYDVPHSCQHRLADGPGGRSAMSVRRQRADGEVNSAVPAWTTGLYRL